MKTFGFLLFNDVEELDFVGPLEVFGIAASLGTDCRTVLVAQERKATRCRHGLSVVPDYDFAGVPALDLLIVPGGRGARTHARENPAILEFVRQQRGFVASVCTGALILAAAGVLDGLPATTHHSSFDLLRRYNRVEVREGVRFVIGAKIATSAGVSAGIDLALALVERHWGAAMAQSVAAELEWSDRGWTQIHGS